jgi:hypothetical protein
MKQLDSTTVLYIFSSYLKKLSGPRDRTENSLTEMNWLFGAYSVNAHRLSVMRWKESLRQAGAVVTGPTACPKWTSIQLQWIRFVRRVFVYKAFHLSCHFCATRPVTEVIQWSRLWRQTCRAHRKRQIHVYVLNRKLGMIKARPHSGRSNGMYLLMC